MGTPPEPSPPAPVPGPPPAPPPPAPAPGPPAPNGGPPSDQGADVARLTAALEQERRRAAAFEGQLTKLKNAQMSDQDKAVAAAKDEGRSEALKAAGVRLAAAEFRAAATGKLADPLAALEVLDLAKYVQDDGEVDSAALAAMVDKLAAALPAAPPPPPGHVPAGPHGAPPEQGDFIRTSLRSQG